MYQFEVLENENSINDSENIISLNWINGHQNIIDLTRTITSRNTVPSVLWFFPLLSFKILLTCYILDKNMLKTFLNKFKCSPEKSTNGHNGISNKFVSLCIILDVKGSKEENSLTIPFSVDCIKDKKKHLLLIHLIHLEKIRKMATMSVF